VDRTQAADLGVALPPRLNVMNRGRRSVAVDLKSAEGKEVVLRLVSGADALIEAFWTQGQTH
jgi:alpha-methylacyl-CoA racemase